MEKVDQGDSGGGLMALLLLVPALFACWFFIPKLPAPPTSFAPPQAAGPSVARDWADAADSLSASLEDVMPRVSLEAPSTITSYAGDVAPTLPRFDSPHTMKHSTYRLVLEAINAWLLEKTACGAGVTAHLKTDTDYVPPALEIMTVCWHIGSDARFSGFVLVDTETGVGITGFIVKTNQLCKWLVRDGYTPSTAPACLSAGTVQ